MSKIATISCIILAVSINFEGIQANLLNSLNPILNNVQKQFLGLATTQKTEQFITTTANLQNQDASVGGKFGVDLTTEWNKLINENKGLIQQASIFTCISVIKEIQPIIKKLESNLHSCISNETQTIDGDIQTIKILLSDLGKNITEKIEEIISQHSGNFLAALPDLIKELPKFFIEHRSTIEEILSKTLDLFLALPKVGKCFEELYLKNSQEDVHKFINDAKQCYQSIPH